MGSGSRARLGPLAARGGGWVVESELVWTLAEAQWLRSHADRSVPGWAGGSPWDQIHRNKGAQGAGGVGGAAGAEVARDVAPEGGVPAGGAVQHRAGASELPQPQIPVQPGATMETPRVSPGDIKQQIHRLPAPPAFRFPLGFASHSGCQGAQRALLSLPPRPFGAIQVTLEHEGAAPARKSPRSVFVTPSLRAPGAHARSGRGRLPRSGCLPRDSRLYPNCWGSRHLHAPQPFWSSPVQASHPGVRPRTRTARAHALGSSPGPAAAPRPPPPFGTSAGTAASAPPARGAPEPPRRRVPSAPRARHAAVSG